MQSSSVTKRRYAAGFTVLVAVAMLCCMASTGVVECGVVETNETGDCKCTLCGGRRENREKFVRPLGVCVCVCKVETPVGQVHTICGTPPAVRPRCGCAAVVVE